MIFTPKTVFDKQGREITLRSAGPEDAEALLEYLKTTAGETPFLVREPDEVTLTVPEERELLAKKEAAENELMLLAICSGKHAGNAAFSSPERRRFSHRCSVAIALYREFWGAGIGEILLRAVLDEAAACGCEQAELEVAADNERAIALYKKLGFEIYGRQPRSMKYADGSYTDFLWMMKPLR